MKMILIKVFSNSNNSAELIEIHRLNAQIVKNTIIMTEKVKRYLGNS
jgi:hypothetical protein